MEPDVSQILIVANDLDLKHKITQHYASRRFHVTATNDPLHALDFFYQCSGEFDIVSI